MEITCFRDVSPAFSSFFNYVKSGWFLSLSPIITKKLPKKTLDPPKGGFLAYCMWDHHIVTYKVGQTAKVGRPF